MSEPLLDAAGRRRSPTTLPHVHAVRPPRNKGIRDRADPPTVEEIVTIMRGAGDGVHGRRLRVLILVVVEPSRSTLSLLLLVATATVLELPPMASLAEGNGVPLHRGPRVGPKWRLRWSSLAGAARAARKMRPVASSSERRGSPFGEIAHVVDRCATRGRRRPTSRMRSHRSDPTSAPRSSCGRRGSGLPGGSDDRCAPTTTIAARYRSVQARTYSSVHTASRVEPDGRDPSRVRARAGHAKSPPPRWRRALLAAPPRRRARSSLSQSSQAPACCRPTANARGASGATRRAPVRLARGSETRCQGRLRRRPVILGSCPGPWIQ
jgi:hypothetical protein